MSSNKLRKFNERNRIN